jgi:hypothetical protein
LAATARAVHSARKQRKLFNIRENSASCSPFEKTRKLFIIREGSASCPSFEKTAQAVHRNKYQRRQQQLGLFAVRNINAS